MVILLALILVNTVIFNNTIANYIFVSGMERSGFPETLIYLFREWNEVDFPKLLCYPGFGKSYLIPETIDFDIGEGINLNKD